MAGMVLTVVGLLAVPSNALATSQVSTSCAGTVHITRLEFTPPSVSSGGSSTANLALQNCTGSRQATTATWLGRFIGSSAGIPTGCPVLDPLPQQAALAPYGRFRSAVGYQVPVSCTASQLQITVRIQQGGTILAQQTANLAITQG
jgi:hypothetical protein